MRGGALPPALLALALGFALTFAPRRAWPPAIAAFVALGVAAAFAPAPPAWTDAIFYGCWGSVVATALAVHLPRGLDRRTATILAANNGVWAGAVIAAAGAPLDLAKSLPWVLICIPGAWIVARRLQIAVKVVSSWLIAVSVLAATVPTTTPTPGYMGDHLE